MTPIFENLFENKNILDIGAGAGFFSWLAQESGASVTANELNENSCKEIEKIFPNIKVNKKNIFKKEFLELKKQFDYSIFLTVIHWLWEPKCEEITKKQIKDNYFRFDSDEKSLDLIIDKINFYTKKGVFFDFVRNKKYKSNCYQKELFEDRLKRKYSTVDVLKHVNDKNYDSTIYLANI